MKLRNPSALLFTVAVLVFVEWLVHYSPPVVDRFEPRLAVWLGVHHGIDSLVWTAAIAFMIVELCSFFVPRLVRLREEGEIGRRKMDRISWTLAGLLLIVRFGMVVAPFWEFSEPIAGVARGGFDTFVHSFAFLSLLTAAVYLGASLVGVLFAWALTRWGSANGFCLMLFASGLTNLLWWQFAEQGFARMHSVTVALVVLGVATAWYLRQEMSVRASLSDEREIAIAVPRLPQSALPIWFALVVASPDYAGWRPSALDWLSKSTFAFVATVICSLIGLSWFFLLMFSTPRRMGESFSARCHADAARTIRKSAVLGFIAPLGMGLLFAALYSRPEPPDMLTLAWGLGETLVVIEIGAILADAATQWDFKRRTKDPVRLMRITDAHVAAYALSSLSALGIHGFVQGYYFRRLYFDFFALLRMELYVAAADEARAREWMVSDERLRGGSTIPIEELSV